MIDTGHALLVWLFSAVVLAVLATLPVWLLWNDLIPSLLHLRQISFGEAFELTFLCGCLFRSSK